MIFYYVKIKYFLIKLFTISAKKSKMVVESGTEWGKVGDFMFMGEYHHTIDDKGRLIIPSKLRYELGEEFIVTKGLDGCLFVYPKNEWENITKKYKDLPNTKDARNYLRFFLSGAIVCGFDKQGRINITQPLVKYADLKKDCVVIGVNERLEIWDQERFDKFLLDNEASMSDIAENLFASNF